MKAFVKDDHAIREIVRKFENCEYSPEEFTHAHHLSVASWYLCAGSQADALSRMRAGLKRFIAHHGKQGYHETITRFWMELLAAYLDQLPDAIPLVSKVNSAVERYSSKEILFSYYTRERVMSDKARQAWIAPDLHPIGKLPVALATAKVQTSRD
jgi:hypothetical protein